MTDNIIHLWVEKSKGVWQYTYDMQGKDDKQLEVTIEERFSRDLKREVPISVLYYEAILELLDSVLVKQMKGTIIIKVADIFVADLIEIHAKEWMASGEMSDKPNEKYLETILKLKENIPFTVCYDYGIKYEKM